MLFRSGMFYNANKLKTLNLGASVRDIGAHAFQYCKALKRVVVPGSVKTIKEGTFASCDKLSMVILEKGVKQLDVYAFGICASLGVVAVPTTVKTIHDQAFMSVSASPEEPVNPNVVIASAKGSVARQWGIDRGLTTIEGVITMSGNLTKTVYKGCKYQIDVSGKTIKSCVSSNKKVATVTKTGGRITAKAAGTAKITVTLTTGKKWVLTLKVKDGTIPKKVAFSVTGTQSLYLGEKLKLGGKVVLTPTKSGEKASSTLTWKSSNTKVAKVSSKGVVTPVKTGTATITVTAKRGGKKASIKVKVKDPSLPKSIAFGDKSAHYVTAGNKWNALNALIITWPRPALAPKYPKWKSWTTSNKKIATVSSKGMVKLLKPGKVTITATTTNGKTASITWDVQPDDGFEG